MPPKKTDTIVSKKAEAKLDANVNLTANIAAMKPETLQEPTVIKRVFQTAGGETLIDERLSSIEENVIQTLYKHALVLDDVENASKNEASYVAIIKAVKGIKQGKMLASQFIPKYLKYFPKRVMDAINAQIDLCEDELKEVRVSAIKGLPMLCKDSSSNVEQVVTVLGQLLASQDSVELEVVKKALLTVFSFDAKETLKTLFQLCASKETESLVRERLISFIREKILSSLPDSGSDEDKQKKKEYEDIIVAELKKLIGETSSSITDLLGYLSMLRSLKAFDSFESTSKIFQSIPQQKYFPSTEKNGTDAELLSVYCQLVGHLLPIFRRKMKDNQELTSSFFINPLVKFSLTGFSRIPNEKVQLKVLETLAQLSTFCTASDARAALPVVYRILHDYLPLRPTGIQQGKSATGELQPVAGEEINTAKAAQPIINFTFIECLLFTINQFALKAPGALNAVCGLKIVTGQPQDMDSTDHVDKLKDFMARLDYLEPQADILYKRVSLDLAEPSSSATAEELATLENIRRQQIAKASRTGKNILQLIAAMKSLKFVESGQLHLSFMGKPPFSVEKKGKRKREGDATVEKGSDERNHSQKKQNKQQQQHNSNGGGSNNRRHRFLSRRPKKT